MTDALFEVESLVASSHRHGRELLLFPEWPRRRAQIWIDQQHRRLFHRELLDGEAIAVPLANDNASLLALLLIGAGGGVAVPFHPEATDHERAALMRRAGATRVLMPGDVPQLVGSPGGHSDLAGGMLLATSGSTGAPKLARRSLQSLLAEGQRYVDMLALSPGARVVIAAPVAHAYALGWVAACLTGGWCIEPVEATALGRIAEELVKGADWAVMTPAIARLLAERPRSGPSAAFPARCRVMVGAGPVTSELETKFQEKFAIGLARNYGSAETGAFLSGFEGLPSGCPGMPMPGVRIRIVDEHGDVITDGTPGYLEVATPEGWHAMGDLVQADPDGRVTILGRSTEAVRRGDRWIAALDIEAHLSDYPGLRALRVSKTAKHSGRRERLVVDIWPNDPTGFDLEAFSSFIEYRLQPSMRPDEIRVRTVLIRSEGGKLQAPTIWRRGAASDIAAVARAYKRAELAFALNAAGVLDLLDGRNSTEEIAAELGLDAGALEGLLTIAARFGVVRAGLHEPIAPDKNQILALETELSRKMVDRDSIMALMRSGLSRRGGSIASSDLAETYLRAMNGDASAFRVRYGLRLLGLRPGSRLLEITAGPGMYGLTAAAHGLALAHSVWPVGPAASEDVSSFTAVHPETRFDAIVLFNGLRWSPVPDRLAGLKAMLEPGAPLLIDDLFLEDDEASAEFALDWLTHGGAGFLTRRELTAALTVIGFDVEARPIPGSAHAHLVVARLSGD
jgi:acyl-CoA synthetase (AMP-forming)/AMP-acid ligase II